jgi:hypothetical protein
MNDENKQIAGRLIGLTRAKNCGRIGGITSAHKLKMAA